MNSGFAFGYNINGGDESGIVNLKTMRVLCLCNEDNSKLIINAIEDMNRLDDARAEIKSLKQQLRDAEEHYGNQKEEGEF